MMTSHDEALLTALKEGHADAFDQLYSRYNGPLFLMAYKRLKNAELAQEIVHDCLMDLYLQKRYNNIQVSLTSLLCGILFNKCSKALADLIKNRKRKHLYLWTMPVEIGEMDKHVNNAAGGLPLSDEFYNVQCEKAMRALAALPPQQNAVVNFVFLEECSYKKAAEFFKISINTLKTNLRKAKLNLRLYMETHEI
jgi:RNA polymerase sigma-70 factor (ECF subfamily)